MKGNGTTPRVPSWGKQNNNKQRKPEMADKKPQIVAKSAAKQQFVAGCPVKTDGTACHTTGGSSASKCMINHIK